MGRLLTILAAILLGPASTGIAAAQNYPTRPITMIVPFPAGGATDTLARFLAEQMRPILGQTVVIENVGGAAGSLGVGRAVRSAADGYTLSIGTSTTHMLTGGLYALPFDLLKDLEPVIQIGSEPLLIVGKKSLPADDLKGLIGWLKANPDKASVGIAGVGATGHLTGISFQKETGTKFQFVPYRGNGPAMQDLLSGQIDFMIEPSSNFRSLLARRQRQALCDHRQDAAAVVAGYPDRRRGGTARLLRLALVRIVGAEGYAEGDRRQAERHHGAGAGRSPGAEAFCRTRHRDHAIGPAIAGSLARLSRRPRPSAGGRSSRRRTSRWIEGAISTSLRDASEAILLSRNGHRWIAASQVLRKNSLTIRRLPFPKRFLTGTESGVTTAVGVNTAIHGLTPAAPMARPRAARRPAPSVSAAEPDTLGTGSERDIGHAIGRGKGLPRDERRNRGHRRRPWRPMRASSSTSNTPRSAFPQRCWMARSRSI